MNKIVITGLAALFGVTLSLSSQAAVEGFNNQTPQNYSTTPGGFENNTLTTVAGVKKDAYDDQIVYLRGRLVKFLGKDMYEFADVKGDIIKVELDDDQNWSHINKDQLIDIVGKVDKDFIGTKIEVKSATVVNQ